MPCAGRSSRFPNMRPKYLLTDFSGKLMIQRSVEKYVENNQVHIIILREHIRDYDAFNILSDAFKGKVNIIILENPTNGPAETVFQALKELDIENDFIVKDCDSFFDFEIENGNIVYTSRLSKNPSLKNVCQLGYVICNDQNIISNLVEKKIVSDNFCVGGYQFKSKKRFIEVFEKLGVNHSELYISNIIDYMIMNGDVFVQREVYNYVNVGTADAWFEFNNKPTFFCDIDGVIIKNKSAYGKNKYHTNYEPLQKNLDSLKNKLRNGSTIIFVTARNKAFYDVTRKMLDELGFEGCDLIMGLNHSKRYIINDFDFSNPYPSCVAVNLKRNGENLNEYI